MGSSSQQNAGDVWALAASQHGVVARRQLLALGLSPRAIQHRLSRGRLHSVERGVYVVGRPALTRRGRWMAAVLGCGPGAALSHRSAAALFGIDLGRAGAGLPIEVSIPVASERRRPGVLVYRRPSLGPSDLTTRDGIPLTNPVVTLIDLGWLLGSRTLVRAVNEADKLGLVDEETLRAELERHSGRRGVAALRRLLGDRAFRLTDSELERRFLRLVSRAGLPVPITGARLNGYRVDFHWPDRGLVVETDGLRYHRTAVQQARDRERDQAHAAAGLTTLRFTHAQIRHEPNRVARTLRAVLDRLA